MIGLRRLAGLSRWLPGWTVRTRIIVWTSLLVVILVAGLAGLLINATG